MKRLMIATLALVSIHTVSASTECGMTIYNATNEIYDISGRHINSLQEGQAQAARIDQNIEAVKLICPQNAARYFFYWSTQDFIINQRRFNQIRVNTSIDIEGQRDLLRRNNRTKENLRNILLDSAPVDN